MKVYISLPISGHDLDERRAAAEDAAQRLRSLGHDPVNPFDIARDPEAPYAEILGQDVTAVMQSDAIVLLPHWSTSKGCTLEKAAAEIYGAIVYYSLAQVPPCNPDKP